MSLEELVSDGAINKTTTWVVLVNVIASLELCAIVDKQRWVLVSQVTHAQRKLQVFDTVKGCDQIKNALTRHKVLIAVQVLRCFVAFIEPLR